METLHGIEAARYVRTLMASAGAPIDVARVARDARRSSFNHGARARLALACRPRRTANAGVSGIRRPTVRRRRSLRVRRVVSRAAPPGRPRQHLGRA